MGITESVGPAPEAGGRSGLSPWLLLCVGIAGVSTATLWIRLSSSGPMELAFRRLVLALPAILIIARVSRAPLAPVRRLRGTLLFAGLCLAAHFALWIASLSRLPAATSLILVSLHPVLILCLEALLMRAPLRLGPLLGVGAAVAGTAVLSWQAGEGGAARGLGIALALGGAAAMAGYLLAGRRARATLSLPVYVLFTYGIAAAALAMLLLLRGDALFPENGREWGLAWLLALFPTLLGHTPMNAALRHLPATVVSTAFLGEVVGGSLLVWAVLGRAPQAAFWLGGPLIATGIILVAWGGAAASDAGVAAGAGRPSVPPRPAHRDHQGDTEQQRQEDLQE